MVTEKSDLYFGRTVDGTYVTVEEYVGRRAGLGETPELFCPMCHQTRNESQPLCYDSPTNRFVHTDVNRTCFRDDRSSRDHHIVQQAVYAKLASDPTYEEVKTEYSLKPNFYDVGAATLQSTEFDGVAVEVNHACGNFKTRVPRKINVAFAGDHGIHLVFTPTSSGKDWFERAVNPLVEGEYTAGVYEDGEVELGTLISPGSIEPRSLYQSDSFGATAD